jgi:membrane dipeptidase
MPSFRLVASRGGFVGIYFMPLLNPRSVATAADVVPHIEHAVQICGDVAKPHGGAVQPKTA